MSIAKSIGTHIRMSALHGRIHLFSMSKAKWVAKHIVSRIVIFLLIPWCGIAFYKIAG